jgi:hypothetical protein
MEALKKKATNVLLPSKHYISPFNFKNMLQWEEACQCYMGTSCRGDKAAFTAHVFVALKNFVLNNL